jgi:hypothetical protein
MPTSPAVPVYLEVGARRTFAAAIDWPGWCRAGKGEEAALAALAAAAPRYAAVARLAGDKFTPQGDPRFDVVERVAGNATTDFGAPGVVPDADRRAAQPAQRARLAALVDASWKVLDTVWRKAPAELRKGPRGGGRDRDRIFQHVLGAEAAYMRKLGLRHPEPGAHDIPAIAAMRGAILAALGGAALANPEDTRLWPARYAARRIAWHVLDHAWEIEDRSSLD